MSAKQAMKRLDSSLEDRCTKLKCLTRQCKLSGERGGLSRFIEVARRVLKIKFVSPILIALLIIGSSMLVTAVTWSYHEIRLTTYMDFDGIPAVIETDDRTVWIFWTRKTLDRYNVFYVTSAYGEAAWSQETQLTSSRGANSGVSVCQASDSTIWLVWASDRTGNYDLYYKTSSDYGGTWSNDTQLTFHSGRDLKPAIRQMSDGTIWIVWSSNRSGGYDLYLKTSQNNGDSWSDDMQLTTDPSLDKMPSLAQMSNGTIWLVWASDRTGNYDLYYKTSSDFGNSWSGNTQLSGGSTIDSNPCVFQTMDGTIWIFWSRRQASENATDDIYYKHSSDNGVSWSDSFQLTSDNYDDIWPSATQTSRVKIWVVWTSDRADQPDWGNYDIYYRTSLVGDVNGDGIVNVVDLTIVALSYGFFEGEPGYDPEADINSDGLVDMRDLTLVAMHLGVT